MLARKSAPFCHSFEADGRRFVYDVHTNALLEVEPVLAAVLPLYGPLTRRGITTRLAPKYGVASLREAFAAIERGRRERGLFLSWRPRPLPPPAALAEPGVGDRDLQHLVLTVTERCNLRCRYCIHGADLAWVRPHGEARMTPEVALRAVTYFLDRADPATDPVISFYGGEALLEFELIATVVNAARGHPRGAAVRFAIDSNGVLLDDRAIELAVREEMFLQISLDGPASEHDRHRVDAAGGATHARIEVGLDRLLKRDPSAAGRLTFMVTLAPPIELPAVARYFGDFPPFRRRGISRPPRLHVSCADVRGHEWPATHEQVQALRRAMDDEQSRYLFSMSNEVRHEAGPIAAALCEPMLIRWHHRPRRPLGRTWIPGANCRPGRRKLHVMPDGSFHPCERTGNAMPIGDLAGGIDPRRVRRLDRQFHAAVASRCRDCWALRICSLCFAAQARESGSAGLGNTPTPELCATQRRLKEEQLALVARAMLMPPVARKWLENTVVS